MTTYTAYSNTDSDITDNIGDAVVSTAPLSRLYFLRPRVVFAARVNAPAAAYPVTQIPFDGVTTGAYGDIAADMILTLGSAPGLDDRGRVRVQNIASATAIQVGRISSGTVDGTLTVNDNDYITIWDDYRVWAKMPYITPAGVQYKDANVTPGDYMSKPPPVANIGGWVGDTIDPDTGVITVGFTAFNSIAVAAGSTIVSVAWDIVDGTVIGGDIDEASLTVTFPPGYRWVAGTVVDSNGKAHTARALVVARDPDDDICVQHWAPVERRVTQQGQTVSFDIGDDLPRSDYPDGAAVMWWYDGRLDASDRSNMQFCGWHQRERAQVSADEQSLTRSTQIECVDVGGRLALLPGFPVTIEVPDEGTAASWSKAPAPNLDFYIHYLLHWHSTALALADYFASGIGDDFPLVIFQSQAANLYDQVNDKAKAFTPDHLFNITRGGALRVIVNPMLQNPEDRTSTIQGAFVEQHWNDLQMRYERQPKVHTVRGNAIATATEWTIVEGEKTLGTYFSIAPGTAPGQGTEEMVHGEALARSQDDLNDVTGHRYARANARLEAFPITAPDGDDQGIEPANMTWVQLVVTEATAPQRGVDFESIRCLCKEIAYRYSFDERGDLVEVQLTLEEETVGQPGVIDVRPDPLAVGETPAVIAPPIPPPEMGLIEGQELVAGIGKFGRYRTFDFQTPSGSGGPTYEFDNLTGSDEMLTWVVDPFSPGYAPGATSGSIDGWAASATAIYRIEDIFGATDCNAIMTFPTTALWRTIQASFGAYFFAGLNPWLICVSYYGSTGGHTGTWASYSLDGGATWADEVQVSAFYDSGGAVNPVALFTSPRTPGYALTAAHIATANPGVTHGFVTNDWGATWTEMSATEDPVELMPGFCEFDGSSTGAYTYLGPSPSATIADVATTSSAPVNVYETLVIAPPKNTKRMVVLCTWTNEHTKSGGFGGGGGSLTLIKPSSITRTGTSNFAQATVNAGPLSGSFSCEYTFPGAASGDWPVNREGVDVTQPADATGVRYLINASASVSGGNTRTVTVSVTCTVTEIELDSGLIYTPTQPGLIVPVNGSGGEIHIPFESNLAEDLILYGSLDRSGNRQFDLKQASGGAVTVIGPTVSSIQYGVNHGQFAVRCHDWDRTLVLLAGTGNDTTASAANDKQGLWFSSNGGGAWTQRIAPTTSTEPYSAAFSGSLDGVVYIWGPPNYFGYSEDNAATIDSRAGNLSALSATHLIGICGGPLDS